MGDWKTQGKILLFKHDEKSLAGSNPAGDIGLVSVEQDSTYLTSIPNSSHDVRDERIDGNIMGAGFKMKKEELLQKFKDINDKAQLDILKKVGDILDLQKENFEVKETNKGLSDEIINIKRGCIFSLDEAMNLKKEWQDEIREELKGGHDLKWKRK